MRMLLVGGNEELASTLQVVLSVRWHALEFRRVRDTREALKVVRREEPSLLLVSLEDPGNCCDLITQVRSSSQVPIVVIDESDDLSFRVRALETGADDWIKASAIPMEFIARINALLRRCHQEESRASTYINGALRIDFSAQEARIDGRRAALTPIEFKVLSQLALSEGSVVTRERLLEEVWGTDAGADPEFVKKYIHRLRTKLGDDPDNPHLILNRRGVGYMLAASGSSRD